MAPGGLQVGAGAGDVHDGQVGSLKEESRLSVPPDWISIFPRLSSRNYAGIDGLHRPVVTCSDFLNIPGAAIYGHGAGVVDQGQSGAGVHPAAAGNVQVRHAGWSCR